VVYLPTRSPELNPIELIFHIFSRWIRLYRMRQNSGPSTVPSSGTALKCWRRSPMRQSFNAMLTVVTITS
jgi:hypothetical protein